MTEKATLLNFSQALGKEMGIPCDARPLSLEMLHQFAESLGLALDARDESTHDHSRQVADIASILTKELGLSESRQQIIHIAGHLHDIGKIALPDNILKKQGPLSETEWQHMRDHPVAGARIVEPIRFFCSQNGIREIILYHHERFDGRGYPHGLRAAEIPIGARIIAVADSLSAMIQNRCYRQGFCFEAAVQEISKCQGSQFCPTVVAAFLRKETHIRELLIQITKDFDPLVQHGKISRFTG